MPQRFLYWENYIGEKIMPDYENDLAFKPAMTWEDLVRWLKKEFSQKLIEDGETISMYSNDFFLINNMCFAKCGNILTDGRCYIAENKTPEQMKTIIEALWG